MESMFSLTFGLLPSSYINRGSISKQIADDFSLDFPLSHLYVICGIRGSGKTVLLTDVARTFKEKEDWIVIDVNPNREILEQVASGLYENSHVKHLFLSKSFSFSFHGLGFTIEGKEPVSNIKTIVEKMLAVIKKHNKRVLITIDEASNNTSMRAFAHDFQSFLRDEYPVFSLMTGLYENVNSLQNNKDLTFLYRAPKINLKPLDILKVENEYQKIFVNSKPKDIHRLALLTKGYAFAYQVAGYLYTKYNDIDKLISEFDTYMAIYVYDKIWSKLPKSEKTYLQAFDEEIISTEELIKKTNYDSKEISVYRDRLLKRGIIESVEYGKCTVILPRFIDYIKKQLDI